MKKNKIQYLVVLLVGFILAIGLNSRILAQDTEMTRTSSDSHEKGVLETLEKHFREAQKLFENKDYKESASELNAAAKVIREQAGQSTAELKVLLTKIAGQLENLSKRVREEESSDQEIKNIVSLAYSSLADSYKIRASESWLKKDFSRAGDYIREAAVTLENAWKWSGLEIDSAAKDVISSAREVGDKIEMGTDQVSKEFSKALDDLKNKIAEFTKGNSGNTVRSVKISPIERPEIAIYGANLVSAISKVAESAIPAVVRIEVSERREVPNPFLPFEGSPFWRDYFNLPKSMPKKFKEELMGIGTGIIIDPEGYILTNNHVVSGATKIQVFLSEGKVYNADLVGTDPKTDLGVIKISDDRSFPYLNFGDSDAVKVGQWVIAIGQPRGLEQTVTQGIISAKHRSGIMDPSSYQDFLQTDAAINPGNSGGPLLTLEGLVIGINSAIATQSGGFEGIGFSIPSRMAVRIANALIKDGKVIRGWMGTSVGEITPDQAKSLNLPNLKGALIANVMKGGPADDAGLQKGDIVLEYNGEKIDNASDLRNKVATTEIGKESKIVVLRNGEKKELKIKIGNLEDLAKKLAAIVKQRLGLEVRPVSSQEAEKYGMSTPTGVSIQWVDPQGPLGKFGFEKGDLILMIGQQPVANMESFVNMIDTIPPGKEIAILAMDHRTGNTGYVKVTIN